VGAKLPVVGRCIKSGMAMCVNIGILLISARIVALLIIWQLTLCNVTCCMCLGREIASDRRPPCVSPYLGHIGHVLLPVGKQTNTSSSRHWWGSVEQRFYPRHCIPYVLTTRLRQVSRLRHVATRSRDE
jgi:hypothetical protein